MLPTMPTLTIATLQSPASTVKAQMQRSKGSINYAKIAGISGCVKLSSNGVDIRELAAELVRPDR
jgi:hypothetical protein